MAFIFSTSHLPETRFRRPDHLEEEEDEEFTPQPMPRAGGVRAFSHLPVRDNPAPSTGPLREDSPQRGIVPIPPLSATPSTSEPPMSAPPPEADSDPEDDTAPQDHADDRPWYMPRITARDLPPQDHPEDAHATFPKPWENTTRSSGFSPSTQDLRDDFHSPTPDTPTGKAPAQDNSTTLPRGRIFEKRGVPAAFLMQQQSKDASGYSSQQRLQGSPQALAAQLQRGRSHSLSSPQQGMQRFQTPAPAPQQQGGGRLTLGQGPASPSGTVQPQNQGQQTPPPPARARDQEKQTSLEKNTLENVPEEKSLNTTRPLIDPNKILWLKNAVDAGDRQAVYDAVRQNITVEGFQLSDKLTPLEKLRLTTESNRIANRMIDEIVNLAF